MRLLCLLLAASSILNGIVAFPIPRIQQRSVDEAVRFFHDRATIHLNLDPRSALFNSVLKRLPATTSPHSKLQQAAQVKRQSGNGNNDSGNGNGNNGSNNGNTNSGGGGSSTTDRNIALGVGIGVGLPGAIAGLITIYQCCCKPKSRKGPDGEVKHEKKEEKHLRRSQPSPQDTRTQAQVPEPRGASELASQQPQRPYELATYG